jgi:putative transposase
MPTPQGHLNDATQLTSAQTLEMAVKVMQDHLPLVFDSPCYGPDDIWRLLLLAAAQGRSIDSAPADLACAPSPSTIRYQLRTHLFTDHDLAALEERLNAALVSQHPPGIKDSKQRIAVDLTLIPYHGQPAKEPNEIRRGEAKSGTTHFHCYASAYLIRHNQRVTLALSYVQADDSVAAILQRLLDRLKAIQIEPKRLYLDRQFFSVELLRLLKIKPFTTILPVPVRGKRLRLLLRGRQSYQTSYEVKSPKNGSELISLYVVCRYAKGRRGLHRVEHLPYAVIGQFDGLVAAARREHRARFGIESSYRLGNILRARTSSRDPKLRLLLVGLSAIMVNLWVLLKWTVASMPRPGRGGRTVREDLLRLSRLRTFLTVAVQAIYGIISAIRRPTSKTTNQRHYCVASSLALAEY